MFLGGGEESIGAHNVILRWVFGGDNLPSMRTTPI